MWIAGGYLVGGSLEIDAVADSLLCSCGRIRDVNGSVPLAVVRVGMGMNDWKALRQRQIVYSSRAVVKSRWKVVMVNDHGQEAVKEDSLGTHRYWPLHRSEYLVYNRFEVSRAVKQEREGRSV